MSEKDNQDIRDILLKDRINFLQQLQKADPNKQIQALLELEKVDNNLSYDEKNAIINNNVKAIQVIFPGDENKKIRDGYREAILNKVLKKDSKAEKKVLDELFDKIATLIEVKKINPKLSLSENNKIINDNQELINKIFPGDKNENIRKGYNLVSLNKILEVRHQEEKRIREQKEEKDNVLQKAIYYTLKIGFEDKKPRIKIAEDIKSIIKSQPDIVKNIDDKTLEQSSKFLVQKSLTIHEKDPKSFVENSNTISEWYEKLLNGNNKVVMSNRLIKEAGQIMSNAGIKETTDKNPEKNKFANQLAKDMLNRSKPRSL